MTDSPNCPRCALIVIRRLQRTSQVHPNAPHGVIRRPVTVVIITVREVSSRIVSVHTRYPSCTISSRPWLQTAGNTHCFPEEHCSRYGKQLLAWRTSTWEQNSHFVTSIVVQYCSLRTDENIRVQSYEYRGPNLHSSGG